MSSGTISSFWFTATEGCIAATGLARAVRRAAVALRITRVDVGSAAGPLGARLARAGLAFDALTAGFSTGVRVVLCNVGCRAVRSAAGRIVAIEEASTEMLLDGAREFLVRLISPETSALFASGCCELVFARDNLGFVDCPSDRLRCWVDVDGAREGRAGALEGFSNRVYRLCEPMKVSRSSSAHDEISSAPRGRWWGAHQVEYKAQVE